MNIIRHSKLLAFALGLALSCLPLRLVADDIDLFVGAEAGAAGTPNVLIVLDNTANWSRQSQKWPGGLTQGQSEVLAIKQAINALAVRIDPATGLEIAAANVGLMEFVTGGNANNDGGFVRYAISPMTTANKATFSNILDTINSGINSPNEKRNANTSYGNLMYDIYNYFAGADTYLNGGANGVITTLADANGYTTKFTTFKSPLTGTNTCAPTVVIFVGNPNSSGPSTDSSANTAALAALGGNTAQLALPNLATSITPVTSNLGYTSACTSSAPASVPAEFSSLCPPTTGAPNDSCAVSSTDTTTALPACSGSNLRFNVTGTNTTASTSTTTTVTSTGASAACYASASACTGNGTTTADQGGLTCPATTSSGGVTTTHSCTYSCGATSANSCSATTATTTTGPTSSTTTASACSAIGAGSANGINASTDANSPACPADTDSGAASNPRTVVTYVCTAPSVGNQCSGSNNSKHFTISRNVTSSTTTTTTTTTPNNKFVVTRTDTQTNTTGAASTTTTNLGNTFSCYGGLGSCSTSDYSCSGFNAGCACTGTGTTTGSCPSGSRFQITGTSNTTVVTPTGTSSTDTNPFNADEWTRFYRLVGIAPTATPPIPKRFIETYTIDVFNAQQNAQESSLYFSMAGDASRYFAAKNQNDIVTALTKIFGEIQSVNSTFAAASLPVNATNRTQNENQVFIGMFRPDAHANPRWYGNLKRYQVIKTLDGVGLGDVDGQPAVSLKTGFLKDCATSFWTTDTSTTGNGTNTGAYWGTVESLPPAEGKCTASAFNIFSDSPDGPLVEKGAAAEIVRNGNNPPSTDTSPTFLVNRTLYSQALSGGALTTFAAAAAAATPALPQSLIDYVRGQDLGLRTTSAVDREITGADGTKTRPSIHGDVIHSRPLPVNYGGTTGITVYYGANDGTLRAVNSTNGVERWAFVAPEFFSRLTRLQNNDPPVMFPVNPIAGSTKKDYFFDGSVGLFQNKANSSATPPISSKVWIYPTMRRGGRMIYALDVTDPTKPVFKWKAGCPNLTGITGCTTGLSEIGQTWPLPSVALVKGYDATKQKPVVIMGGGYDDCEDADSPTPSCGSTKGGHIYIFDGDDGTLLKTFNTTRSVAADIAVMDVDSDGFVDYAYAVDTGGNIYRMDFVDNGGTIRSPSTWDMHRVAYTNGSWRKFLFPPAVLPVGNGKVYLAIGSGDREHPLRDQYPSATPITNRFYVYLDSLSSTPSASPATDGDSLDSTSTMLDKTTDVGCDNPTATPAVVNTKILPSTSPQKGWFINLTANGTGEQTVTSALIVGGLVAFSTNRPIPLAAQSCTNSLGEARGYLISLFNGSGSIGAPGSCGGSLSSIFVGGGLPPSPVLATVPVTVTVNGVTTIEVHTVAVGVVNKAGGPSSSIEFKDRDYTGSSRRKRVYRSTSGDN